MANGKSLVYVLLSPTFGMHQYTADLAARGAMWGADEVHLVTTDRVPRDRYDSGVAIHTPVSARTTGFARDGLDLAAYRRALKAIVDLASPPDVPADRSSKFPTFEPSNLPTAPLSGAVVHITGVHAWNVFLVPALRRRHIPVIHTLHDLDPHVGVRYAAMIRLWNRKIIDSADRVLVHGRCFRDKLIAGGVPADRVAYAPLLHGFWSASSDVPDRTDAPCRPVTVLFFGRIEQYKGAETLLAAWSDVRVRYPKARLVLAGTVSRGMDLQPLPEGVELRDRRIGDEEALELFRGAALLVLPYRDATQSALVAAAYRLSVPVVVTRTGALPEYVDENVTGWVVPPEDSDALAAALDGAMSNPERLARMGSAARLWYIEHRREENDILRWLYADLAARVGPSSGSGAER